jgi:hypothetical protein
VDEVVAAGKCCYSCAGGLDGGDVELWERGCVMLLLLRGFEQGSLTRHARKAATFTCDDTKRAPRLGARNGRGRTSLQRERPASPQPTHVHCVCSETSHGDLTQGQPQGGRGYIWYVISHKFARPTVRRMQSSAFCANYYTRALLTALKRSTNRNGHPLPASCATSKSTLPSHLSSSHGSTRNGAT